jgi:opacity protein-like surface antigen
VKKSMILATLLTASTSMMGMNLEYFLGAGVERVDGNFKYSSETNADSNGKASMTDEGLKLKAGVILDKTHRISVSHVKYSKAGVDVRTILGNYDYLIPMSEEFRLFAGIHAGSTKVEIESSITDSISFSGLTYGAQAGLIYDITKNIEFETGVAYTKYNVDRAETTNWSGVELEDSASISAGINYKF